MSASKKAKAISDISLFSTTPTCYSCNHEYTGYSSYNLPSCPYIATPTPNANQSSSSCYSSSYIPNSKEKQQNKFRFDFANGFPTTSDVHSSDSKHIEPKIKIISTPEIPQNNIITPTNNESNKVSPKNLKIKIPKNSNNTKSEPFKLINIKSDEIKKEYSVEDATLLLHGYEKKKHIGNTLQGHVISAIYKNNGKERIIKTSDKKLYCQHITIQNDGKKYQIQEDIVKEANLMRQFMSTPNLYGIPSSLIRYYDFFEDKENYYLVMEHGGHNLFDFIVKCHELISSNKLSIKEWRIHYKFMFAQMILCINWMHTVHRCCHLDISLENMLISKDVKITENEEEFSNNKCYVKLIDFGLTDHFDLDLNPFFLCNKFVGKQNYKAPKVYNHKGPFYANKADIWSLGVVLFMMAIGSPPYNKPIDSDLAFQCIQKNKLFQLLQSWNKTHYVTNNLFDLLTKMLCCDESKRIDIYDIMKHPWINVYFPNQNISL